MKVCFPVMENEGLESRVFGHFGSAPQFVVVDTVTNEMTAINNSDQVHEHGACNPVAGLGGYEVDAIVALFRADELPEYMPGHTCGGHDGSHGCSH